MELYKTGNYDLMYLAGYSTYCWLIGSQPDSIFDKDKMFNMLKSLQDTIHTMPKSLLL